MAPMVNYSFAFGQDIAERAVEPGGARHAGGICGVAGRARWGGCFRTSCTASTFCPGTGPGAHSAGLVLDAGMAASDGRVLDGGDVHLRCGRGLPRRVGTSVGWGIFQIFNIMAANISGVLTGEWRQAPPDARRTCTADWRCWRARPSSSRPSS